MRTAFVTIGLAVLVLVAVVVIRTLMHTPPAAAPVAAVSVRVDASAVARHLAEAIRYRTISRQAPGSLDPEAFEGFIAWIGETYPEFSRDLELVRVGGYTLLYRWAGSREDLQPVLLTSHYDVVPVLPGSEEQWSHPPYAGEIAGGFVWGRGALDDKSAVVTMLEAATLLLRDGFEPARTVYFSFGHDEEIGGPEGAASVAEYLASRNVRLLWSLDEGSFLFRGLLPGRLMAPINVAEKGSLTLDIVAKSEGGHSSVPPDRTAVGILAEAITELEAHPLPGGLEGLSAQMFDTASRYMPFSSRMFFANRWLFGGFLERQLSSAPSANAQLRTTTAPTMLRASVKVNVLPIEAIATVNFRLHPRDTVESVVSHVRSVVENESVEVRVAGRDGRAASPVSDWNSPGYDVIATSVREIYGDVVITPGLMIAGSDSKHYGKVADNAFRFNPMVLSQADMAGFHGTNEKVAVETLGHATRTYARIIANGATR